MAQKSNATQDEPPEPDMRALRRVKRMAVNDSFYDEEPEDEGNTYQPTPQDLEANEKVCTLTFYYYWDTIHRKETRKIKGRTLG